MHEKLVKFPANSLVQYTFQGPGRRHTGEVCCGLVVKNAVEDLIFEVLKYPDLTDVVKVHYDDIVLGSADETDNIEFIGMEKAQVGCKQARHQPIQAKNALRNEKNLQIENPLQENFQDKFQEKLPEKLQNKVPGQLHGQLHEQFLDQPQNQLYDQHRNQRGVQCVVPRVEVSPEPQIPGIQMYSFGIAESNYSFDTHRSHVTPSDNGKRKTYVFVNEFLDPSAQMAPRHGSVQLVSDTS